MASEAEVSQEDLGIVEKPPASGSCDQSGAVLEVSSQNDEDVVGEKEEEMNPQRLFESLYPESIPVVLTLKDLLMPSPSLSGAQLETLHDILDKCLRKVVESRIILAVDREREAICAHKNY